MEPEGQPAGGDALEPLSNVDISDPEVAAAEKAALAAMAAMKSHGSGFRGSAAKAGAEASKVLDQNQVTTAESSGKSPKAKTTVPDSENKALKPRSESNAEVELPEWKGAVASIKEADAAGVQASKPQKETPVFDVEAAK